MGTHYKDWDYKKSRFRKYFLGMLLLLGVFQLAEFGMMAMMWAFGFV